MCNRPFLKDLQGLINYFSCVGFDFSFQTIFCIFLVTIVSFCFPQHNRQVVARILELTRAHRSRSPIAHSHCKHLSESDSILSHGDCWGMSTVLSRPRETLGTSRVDGTTLNTTAAARRRRSGWRRPAAAVVVVSVWPLGGRTRPGCSEGSSSASP